MVGADMGSTLSRLNTVTPFSMTQHGMHMEVTE